MVEGGGSESGSASKPMSTCESHGDRLRFTVELRPGETTIVSWKKLLKETSSKPSKSGPRAAVPALAAQQQPAPQPLPPPTALASSEQPDGDEVLDSQGQAGTNRLSTVIEKIERMYAGEGTSEDEEVFLDDVPDDDEYDTEDSFIDDAELDDYFQVDNSSIKHDGFFVNRGKLERIEPATSAKEQPKKRRRKDVTKIQAGNEDGQNPNKHARIGKGRKSSSSIERSITSQFNMHSANVLEASQANAAEVAVRKKTADSQTILNPSGLQHKDAGHQKTGAFSIENRNSKLKDNSELQDASAQRPHISPASKPQHGKPNNSKEVDQSIQQKGKSGPVERFDLNSPPSRDLPQITKVPLVPRKEGSNVRPKVTVLDKAIRDLEKIVSESRPPSTEIQDPDNSSQGVKRRLSPEIKQKLSKVARLAQASYGKIPKDVINRLMSILGHLMQLRTLKRNLRVMAKLGLSARQEKNDRLQKTKQEVAEMVKQRVQYMKSKVLQQTTNTDDFQEIGHEEKEALKRKYSMDDALENKICDLYDLHVERLEEDSGPPVRRLYEELTSLWPSGVMDTDGIKRAIHKAKDRRKALGGRRRDQDKVKRKKALAQKLEEAAQKEPSIVSPVMHLQAKIMSETRKKEFISKTVQGAAVSLSEPYIPVPVSSVPNIEKPKQERMKASNPNDAATLEAVPKKKQKKKQNSDSLEAQLRLEKSPEEADEKHKHHKHVTAPPPKSSLQPGAQSGSDDHS